jgi:NAD(P)-dependent dehydrogenase (short-subunit alcohol dehydrogenase family)
MDLKGKVALLTGGARIGQVVAYSLAVRGCDLALIYRGSREAADASARAAISAGVRAITLRADATDEDQIAQAVKETHRQLGRIDILLNMASIYVNTPDPNEADWSHTIDANARSVFLFSTYVAPIMKQGGDGGRIINFADLAARKRPSSLPQLCALLYVQSRGCGADRKSCFGTGSGSFGQCNRAGADPGASKSDSQREHRGDQCHAASQMRWSGRNRKSGAFPAGQRFRYW